MSKTGAPDVTIVGAGVMGCATALRLAGKGARVTIIERGIPGAEASSAAAGILAAQWEADEPGPLLDLGLRSRSLFAALAHELREMTGQDIGHVNCGLIEVALDDADETALRKKHAWQQARGLPIEIVSGAPLAKLEPNLATSVRMGVRMADAGVVNARSYARALAQAASIAGVRFLQGRYVKRVAVTAGRAVGVELDGETLSAGAVVVAAGSWSGLVEGVGITPPPVRPARGQMVAIETRPPLFRHVIAARGRGYLVPRPDGVALAGSTLEMVGFRKEVTVDGLAAILDMARGLVPALGPAPVVETWSNFRPFTEDHVPIMGATDIPGLFLATGHHRCGILLSPITAQVIAELVADGRSSIDLSPFSVLRFKR